MRAHPPEPAMSLSMHEVAVPAFVRGLASLRNVLAKGAAHAAAKKIEDAVFVNGRLYPDMFPLFLQVQIATDFARGTVARLAGAEPPKWEGTETTFAEMIARVDRALEAVKAATPAQLEGSETRTVVRPIRGEPKTFTGRNYLLQFALPNFYFHLTTAYAILRHGGVEIGKTDFIGPLD
jgi:hypothetical protein